MLCNLFRTRSEREQETADKERLEKLIDFVCKNSPTGKRVVEGALEKGVEISLSKDIDSIGAYSRYENKIFLNSSFGDDVLASTLVHEARHSEQELSAFSSEYDVYTSVALTRAKEADATAYQSKAAREMAVNKEYGPFNAFAKRRALVAIAALGEDPLNKAFKAWYEENSYVSSYDESTIAVRDTGMYNPKTFKTTFSDSELASYFKDETGKAYVEPSFFSSQEASTISCDKAKEIKRIEGSHIRHLFSFKKIKTSADFFYIKNENGVIEPPKRQLEKAEKKPEKTLVSNVALQALQQKKGR